MNRTHVAVGLHQSVVALYLVTIAVLVLRLVVAGVGVVHGVGELVRRVVVVLK